MIMLVMLAFAFPAVALEVQYGEDAFQSLAEGLSSYPT